MDSQEHIVSSLQVDLPTLIVDADEVLLQFVAGLETYFPTRGFELRLDSFQLSGNIYHLETGDRADGGQVKELIADFFQDCVDDVAPVDGAAEALAVLSRHFQIVILSNVPQNCRERRQKSLSKLGMAFPVIANKGEKGPSVKTINDTVRSQTFFIDDLPPNHTSVARHSPNTHRIHYIADKRLAKMLPKAPDAHQRLENWADIQANLLAHIGA